MGSPERKDLLRPLGSKPLSPGTIQRRKERNDRFIPNRGTSDIENSGVLEQLDTNGSEFQAELARQLSVDDHRILSFQNSKPKPPEGFKPDEANLYSKGPKQATAKSHRFIPQQPDRVLDAPDLSDDFYTSILDWSATNKLAVGLGPSLYIWHASTGDVDVFCEKRNGLCIRAVKWSESGTHLALGMSDCTIHLHDVEANKQVRCLRGHPERVNVLDWNGHMLASGGHGSGILNSDVRRKEHVTDTLRCHEAQVCGLQWSPSKHQLASGANDHLLAVWDGRKLAEPAFKFTEHLAAVKALAWCPYQRNLLASGGGTSDHHVRFWNTAAGYQMSSLDAQAQVCSLLWNPHDKELLGGLGFSQNQLCLWRYPSCQLATELNGHESRVLHMALSPDGCTVCSAAADETLRFWKVFEKPPVPKGGDDGRGGEKGGRLLQRMIR